MKAIDLTGKRFSRLVCIEVCHGAKNKNKRKWRCVCDCGNIIETCAFQLRSLKIKSCGCLTKEKGNLVGLRFNKLVVQSLHSVSAARRKLWNCVCDCGNEVVVSSKNLQRGSKKCCGCSSIKIIRQRKPDNYKRARVVWEYCKSNALRKNRDFFLSVEEVLEITSLPCRYCGETKKIGIDRVDSGKGYIQGNCSPCCKLCNWLKSNYPLKEFFAKIKKMHKHLEKNGEFDSITLDNLH